MTKKILLGIFILLIGVVSFIGYNFYKNIKQPTSNTYVAIPQNAAFILQQENLNLLTQKISTTSIIWEELIANTNSAKKINTNLNYLDSILHHTQLNQIINGPALGSAHLSGANDFDFIFYFSINPTVQEEQLILLLKKTLKINPTSRKYDEVNIYSTNTKNKEKLSFTYYKNIFAFSFKTILIEDVIRQLNSENSLLNNNSFTKVLNTRGLQKDGNILINNLHFPKIVSQFINKKTSIKTFSSYANWTELDLSINSNTVMFNGFTHSNDSNNNYLNLFNNQKPQNLEILSITPYNTALLYSYGFSDTKQFFNDKKQLLKTQNNFFEYQKYIDDFAQKHGIDIEEEFLANIGNELAYIITEPLTEDITNDQYIIVKSNNLEKTQKDLINISQKINQEAYPELEFKNHLINKINFNNIFSQLIGKPFININSPFYTFIENYIIFATSENSLKAFISNYSSGKTLENNENFESFNDNLSSDANIFIYNNIARSTNLYKANINENYISIIDEKLELFRKFEAVAFQINSEKNNLYYNNICLKYNPVYKQDTRSLWETELDSIVTRKPQLVLNHKTNTKEIFVQDNGNKIYLISGTGKVLWKKQLNEKIIGDVHQVDVYKNNKLQLIFNTKSNIHLIDRNGNNVENFPVKLPAEATNGISILDYEHNRNYRLLIACNNNMVYNYNTNGQQVKGWEYKTTDTPTLSNIWHIDFSGKDYIIIPTVNGKLKIVDRSGKDRIVIEKQLPITTNPIYLKKGNNIASTCLITADSSGNVFKLFLNNKLETSTFKTKKEAVFSHYNINSDKEKEFIFCDSNNISIFDTKQSKILSVDFQNKINKNPLYFEFPDNSKKIGVVSENEIYLINDKGEFENGFPLAGSTLFSISDINNDNTLNLIVADKKMVYTYNLE